MKKLGFALDLEGCVDVWTAFEQADDSLQLVELRVAVAAFRVW